jgi:hypothetical protein
MRFTWLPLVATMTALALDCAAQQGVAGARYAPASTGISLTPGAPPERKEFSFGREAGSAWLGSNGKFGIEIWVRHAGLRCATYEIGVRFGEGEHGCTRVNWLGEPRWLTSQRQCNNAVMLHRGVDGDPELAAVFERATCAERLVRCEGNCP